MKRIFLAIAMIAFTGGAHAQSSTSTANAGSNASANVGVQSQSGAFVYQEAAVIPSNTTANINNVPAVSAPAVFGGGHPCLAGKSGGVSVLGGGLSYGQGDPEVVCMLWYMGQPEAAIRALVMNSPRACKALGNVGYYRVGKSVIPFDCGKMTKGGVDTPGFKSRTTKVSTRNAPESTMRPKARPNGLTQCEMVNGQVHIGYKYRADKVAAKAICLSSLGY